MSIKSKLIITFLLIALVAILIGGYLGWQRNREALAQSAANQLTSVRADKAFLIETYFQNLHDQVDVLSENDMVIEAMVRLGKAFRPLDLLLIPDEWDESLEQHYVNELFPRLINAADISDEPDPDLFKPESQVARYLQYHFIVANENPVGEKHLLDEAEDDSEYSEFHSQYHPTFREMSEKFGYHDLFLIDFDTEEIIYSVHKRVDFGTSLANGPYAESGLARVVQVVRARPERGGIQVADFEPYTPNYQTPSAFLVAPIYNGPHVVGILGVQITLDAVNNIMTGNKNWEVDGLGQTGESYLVGSDFRMRSVSRFWVDDPQGYLRTLRSLDTPQREIEAIETFSTTATLQTVDTDAIRTAIGGEASVALGTNYLDEEVLSSFTPLEIEGLDWVVISEMTLNEINQPVYTLQRHLLIAAVSLIVIVTMIALIFAILFVRPVRILTEYVQRAEKSPVTGGKSILSTRDELGTLAQAFSQTMQNIRSRAEATERQSEKSTAMLTSLLPGAIAERLSRSEGRIIDSVQSATALSINLAGLTHFMAGKPDNEIAGVLDELDRLLDTVAERHDVERIPLVGEHLFVVCGLSKARLDHVKRTLDYALEVVEVVQGFNNRREAGIQIYLGVDTGSVTMKINNTQDFQYHLWGSIFNTASSLSTAAAPNAIVVSQAIYERVNDLYRFQRHRPVALLDESQVETYLLKGPSGSAPETVDAQDEAHEDETVA